MGNLYPKLKLAEGVIGLRYFSWTNDFIDFVVFVCEDDAEKTKQAIVEAMDEFWDSDDLCFGDCVYWQLKEHGILPYRDIYIEQDDEGECDNDQWEAYLESLNVPIRIVRGRP